MKKLLSILLLANLTSFSQVSKNRLKSPSYGWINRVVPTNALLDSTFSSFWMPTGNAVNSNTAFVGTTNNRSLLFRTNNVQRFKIDSIGNVYNRGNGTYSTNTVFGFGALFNNTLGDGSCAFGYGALRANLTGYNNVAVGYNSLNTNTSGRDNVAIGLEAMLSNTTGLANTAIGSSALRFNLTGQENTAVGGAAMYSNTVGVFNSAYGNASLYNNLTGSRNSGFGYNSLQSLTTGSSNIGIGYGAGIGITTGTANTIIGSNIPSQSPGLNNNIILSDGAGSIRYQFDGTRNVFTNSVNIGNGTWGTSLLHVARFAKGTGTIDIGESSAGLANIWLNQNTPNANNWQIMGDGVNTYYNTTSSGAHYFYINYAANPLNIFSNRIQINSARLLQGQGAGVASTAGAMTLGGDGNTFEITGTNAITAIVNTSWQNGSEITLFFTSTASLTDGTANAGANIGFELAGNVNFNATADDALTLVLCTVGGVQRWREKCRSVN